MKNALFTNDAVVLGLLLAALAFVFVTSNSENKVWKKIYLFFPPVLACYFLPALMNWPLNWLDPEKSELYNVAKNYLLPASLILLCLSIDLKGLINLGSKALIMFFAATLGIIIGGPAAFYMAVVFFPDLAVSADGEPIWKGLSTIAGSWIGGGANQTAMREIYKPSDKLFQTMLLVDVIVGNIWMGILLYGASMSGRIDKWLKADNSAIDDLKQKMKEYSASVSRIPTTQDTVILFAVAFVGVGLSHFISDLITPFMEAHYDLLDSLKLNTLTSSFFWIVVISTTVGLGLSFTPLRSLEGVGASRFGTLCIYMLVATIGMQMNLSQIFNNLGLFFVGIVWMIVHVITLLVTAKIIKAPFFFVAVGSQANVGGAASAPVVAAAFHPALAPVGILMAVLGYALGTYGAIICAQLMQVISPV